ncbi:MAG: NAD(+) synthase [Clostridiales bacterium]|nr:NAD(+) synthase [Clostridiales bacterium]
MKYGYVRCAAVSPEVKTADTVYNTRQIIKEAETADKKGVFGLAFPELCITGYTCGDLFLQRTLLEGALDGLFKIKEASLELTPVIIVGLPLAFKGCLYNVAAVIYNGEILGLVPKTYIPNYNEFYEKRYFEKAFEGVLTADIRGEEVPFGKNLIFTPEGCETASFGVEICEDLWAAVPPSSYHALAGANIIFNPSAGNEITGKSAYRRDLVKNQSARLIGGYVYACAGEGESTTDAVYSGHSLICENGRLLEERGIFQKGMIAADIDTGLLDTERRRNTTFEVNTEGYRYITFPYIWAENTDLLRKIDPMPFVPRDEEKREERCKEIIAVQAMGLKKRLEHVGVKNVVIGISGGLDSTHALLITVEAFKLAGLDPKGIQTVTMPCFGTSERTHKNALALCRVLGTSFREIKIAEAVNKHFQDIGHDPAVHDLTYENSQARERTQVLMDLASRYNGFVVGTGDLSELALGFATYNGDHMSMYNVNCSIPKTLIRYLIKYFADFGGGELKKILYDILDTPVSPELLPPDKEGLISQVTEDIVGPYELHDFFLYSMMRLGFEPDKIFHTAKIAFKDKYDAETIMKWLKKFYYRFFAQQYKRSAIPDGPKVGSVSLSPRGDWRMPSDACVSLWISSLEEIII